MWVGEIEWVLAALRGQGQALPRHGPNLQIYA